jgi:flagellar protein FliS
MNRVPAAAAAYRAANIENAPPLKLVRMMYEGALRFLDQADAGLADKDAARFQERCLRASAVVGELRLALDHRQAPELAASLDSLYDFCEGQLRRALLDESPAPLASVRDVLTTLLDGWRRLEVPA